MVNVAEYSRLDPADTSPRSASTKSPKESPPGSASPIRPADRPTATPDIPAPPGTTPQASAQPESRTPDSPAATKAERDVHARVGERAQRALDALARNAPLEGHRRRIRYCAADERSDSRGPRRSRGRRW